MSAWTDGGRCRRGGACRWVTHSRYRKFCGGVPAPTQKAIADLAGGNQIVEIAVRCRHYANVEARLRVIRAHRLDFPVLEKSQQEGLHAEAHFTDFIEEQRATMCELELAALVAVGAGEASLDVPEQL